MSKYWNCADDGQHWTIERELKSMLEGNHFRFNYGIQIESVEAISINKDSTADADIYGRDEKDFKNKYHLRLKLYPAGDFVIMSTKKQ